MSWKTADKVYDMEYVIDHTTNEFTDMCLPKPEHLKTAAGKHYSWMAKLALQTEVVRQPLRTMFEGKRAVLKPVVAASSHATVVKYFAKRFVDCAGVLLRDILKWSWERSVTEDMKRPRG